MNTPQTHPPTTISSLIARHLTPLLSESLQDTPAVLVNGPRQCGKTTLVQQFAGDLPYFTLDDPNLLAAVQQDPLGFARQLDRAIIDEVQRAPQLLLALKLVIDQDRRPGRFLLTGSANLMALPQIADMTRGNREPIVLPSTTKYTPIQINPEESQFLNTMRYTSEQIIGRVYLEDPADYGLSSGGTSMTYANRSDADLARFKRRQFWVTKLQQALTDLTPRPMVIKLNTSSALMMTTRERHEVHGMRLDKRTTTINEVRKIEDETPFGPEFNEPGIPPFTAATDPQDAPDDVSDSPDDGGAA
jgi:hypothetical protein